MKVVVTGPSSGIGKAIALKFLELGHIVYGIDILKATITNENYFHYICDVRLSRQHVIPEKRNGPARDRSS